MRLRLIEKKDFKEVSDLFEGQQGNSVKELMWLFIDHSDSNLYNAFVAIDNSNAIIGVIGYIPSTYILGEREILAVNPMSWMLKSGYKGIAGVSLFKKVSELGEIAVTIGGAEISQKLYPMFKYKYLDHVDNYYKILNLTNYYKILKRKNFLKKIGMFSYLLPSYFRNISKKIVDKDICLIPYDYNNFVEEKEYENIFRKKITKNYIDWLLDCSSFKTFAFIIKTGEDNLGMCVLYMKKFGNTFKGRIVHLPFLGNDENIWASVIEKCLVFLKKEGCCFVSGVSANSISHIGFSRSGFIKIKNHQEPVYVKDKTQIINQNIINNWHMQYSEGDIFLRNF